MITLLVFVGLFTVYVFVMFFRGVHREKKSKKVKELEVIEDFK